MPPVLDRDAATPLYVQLTDILRDEIERGLWMPDRKIPSENELHRTYGISRMTARQVIAQLVNEGLLYRVQGKGTFVAPNKISTRSPAYAGIREQLEELGYATKTMLLNMEEVAADRAVAKKLARSRRIAKTGAPSSSASFFATARSAGTSSMLSSTVFVAYPSSSSCSRMPA
ncbi:MAG: GntR family transcriptional regulator [Egibacteraceae bacterium]